MVNSPVLIFRDIWNRQFDETPEVPETQETQVDQDAEKRRQRLLQEELENKKQQKLQVQKEEEKAKQRVLPKAEFGGKAKADLAVSLFILNLLKYPVVNVTSIPFRINLLCYTYASFSTFIYNVFVFFFFKLANYCH